MDAGCTQGPTSPDDCIPVCESFKTACAGFDTFVDCAGDAPDFECSADGDVSPVNCKEEFVGCVEPCIPQ